jgi:hypothetical protein
VIGYYLFFYLLTISVDFQGTLFNSRVFFPVNNVFFTGMLVKVDKFDVIMTFIVNNG